VPFSEADGQTASLSCEHCRAAFLGPCHSGQAHLALRQQTPLDSPPPPQNFLCTTPPPTLFTHYIRRLTAQLDSEQYSDGEEHVIWEKGQHVQNHEDFLSVVGPNPMPVLILRLYRFHGELFCLVPVSVLFGIVCTHPGVLYCLHLTDSCLLHQVPSQSTDASHLQHL